MRVFYNVMVLLLLFAPAMQAQVCMGFDGFSGNYGAGNPTQFGQEFYSQDGITLSATGFVDPTGNVSNTAFFFGGTFLYSGLFTAASGVFVKTNNEANLIINTLPASQVSFDYIDRNSTMNFSVNGQPITVIDNLINLPTAIAPGVTLSISETTIGAAFIGTATLTGYITEVIVGGDDMGIDDICFVETAAVCQITSPTVTASACDVNGNFSAEIDFNFSEEGASGFTIVNDSTGVSYGTFAYADLPITINNLVGDNSTFYSFSISDVDNPNCVNQVDLGLVDCPVCNISNVVTSPGGCVTDQIYTLNVDFDYQNNATGFFDVFLDGQYLEPWTYAELPITLELTATSLDPILLTFCDQGSTSCCESVTVDPLNCGAFNCSISNVVASTPVCNPMMNGNFSVDLDFDHENTGTSFTVTGNGMNYGTFFYAELPITLNDIWGDNSTVYQFLVTDTDDSSCSDQVTVGVVNCPLPCELFSPVANPLQCTSDTTFSMTLGFDYDNGNDFFTIVTSGGNFIGNFAYTDLPLTLTDVPVSPGQLTETFVVCDAIDPSCCTSVTFDTPNCEPPSCELSNLMIATTGCDANGDFGIDLNFNHANNGSQFSMYVNSAPVGSYLYSDLPLSLPGFLEGDGLTAYTIMVQDSGDPTCTASFTVQPILCSPQVCAISNIAVDPIQCTSDSTYSLFVNFDFENTGASGFSVSTAEGNLGNFNYTDLPLTLTNFPSATPGTTQFIFICDNTNPDCCQELTFTGLDCTPDPVCELGAVTAVASTCNDSTGNFFVTLDFDFANAATSFTVAGNGVMYGTFNYADLPITLGPLVGDGTTDYEFIVTDSDSPNCVTETGLGTINCMPLDCAISNIVVDPGSCTSDSIYTLVVDFDYANAGTNGFNVSTGGMNLGSFNYADLPLTLDFPSSSGFMQNIFICDNDNSDCCQELTFMGTDCSPNPVCELGMITATTSPCDDSTGNFFVSLDFDFANTATTFTVAGNGMMYGTYNYADLPITLGPLAGDGMTDYEFIVTDSDSPNCVNETAIGIVNCSTNPVCELGNITTTTSPCDDSTGTFFVSLDFDFANTATTFTVAGNGMMYGTYNYADLPITLGPLVGDGMTDYEFFVNDSDNPNCVIVAELGSVNCSLNCELFTPVVDPIQCTSDSTFSLFIDFDYANVSGTGFNMFADGQMIGSYNYTDLPLEINDYPTSGTSTITLMVCDEAEPNCCSSTTFESLNCVEECNIFGVFAEALSCDQGLFLVELNLEYQNPGPLGFQVFGNGTNYGNYSYSDLPITIGALEGDGVSDYEFVVVDLTNQNCSNFTTIQPVNCLDQCVFDEVVATALNCEADGEFMVLLSFTENNVGTEGYAVSGNGTDYGVFDYDTDALVGPFVGDGSTVYEFTLTDMMNDSCRGTVELTAPLCEVDAVQDAFNGAVKIAYNFVGEQVVINMETSFAETSEVYIYDVTGRLRHTVSIAAGTTTEMIDVAHLGTGLFICQLRNSEGSVSKSFVNAK